MQTQARPGPLDAIWVSNNDNRTDVHNVVAYPSQLRSCSISRLISGRPCMCALLHVVSKPALAQSKFILALGSLGTPSQSQGMPYRLVLLGKPGMHYHRSSVFVRSIVRNSLQFDHPATKPSIPGRLRVCYLPRAWQITQSNVYYCRGTLIFGIPAPHAR